MADWYLILSLVTLRREFNILAPNRDTASDGSIGDARHQAEPTSDHNPDSKGAVHAIDVDKDLRHPTITMEDVVQFLLARCRSGQERRLKYIIYNRRIWTASNDWREQDYHSSNPHDKHAHFSGMYQPSSETSTASWHLEDLDMALSADDIKALLETKLSNGVSFGGNLVEINNRTKAINGQQLPAIASALAEIDVADFSPEQVNALAGQIADALDDDVARAVLDSLKARLES